MEEEIPLYLQLIGYSLAVTGSTAFIPQILKVWRSKSGEGLNFSMFTILDFVTSLISAFCIKSGLQYSTWLELLVTNIQVFIIHLLARYYLNQTKKITTLIICKCILVAGLALLPLPYIKLGMNCLLPMMVYNKTTMAYKHYKDKSLGQMAGATLYMQYFQFSGRIFTVLMTGSTAFLPPMLLNWIYQSVFVAQYLWYKKDGTKEEEEKKKE